MSSSSLDNLTPIDLSTLSPESITSQTSLNGIITIKWPYSTSAKKLTFLLADPDPRKRARGGQVKVSLLGKAAEEVDKIESGENIAIALPPNESNEATFEIESVSDTPRVKWHITFPHGCILFVKDTSGQSFQPPSPTKPPIATPLPRVPTPPPSSEPQPNQLLWKTPLKRKFGELTDHPITTSLSDEQEWFGTQPKDPRRFSGRLRFIGLDESTPSSTPQRPLSQQSVHSQRSTPGSNLKFETGNENENSLRRSPDMILRAQNMVAGEILSEKLLHPPISVGSGTDDISHAAVMNEESGVRRLFGKGKVGVGERSFEVYQDEQEEEEEEEEDVLPEELKTVAQVAQWTLPEDEREDFAEKRLPGASTSSVPVTEEECEEEEEALPDVVRQERTTLLVTGDEEEVDEEEDEEEEEEDVEESFEASGQLVQPAQRRYYQHDTRDDSEESEEDEGSDRVDYDHPEGYIDDEEMSPEEYEEEEELHPSRYRPRERSDVEEEYYHSDEVPSEEQEEEEEYESEESEEEYEDEEQPPPTRRSRVPDVVDLTLDSDEEEEQEEVEEEEEEEYESQVEDEDEEMLDEPEWQGIRSQTGSRHSQTPFVSQESQEQHVPNPLDFLLDPTLMAPLPHSVTEPVQSELFSIDPALSAQVPTSVQPDFTQELLSQQLDPALFQQPFNQPLPMELTAQQSGELLDSLLSFPTELSTVPTEVISTQQETQTIVVQETVEVAPSSEMTLAPAAVDETSQQEFLTGLLPMHVQTSIDETLEIDRRESREFLPNIVPVETLLSVAQPSQEIPETRVPHEQAESTEEIQAPLSATQEPQPQPTAFDGEIQPSQEVTERPPSSSPPPIPESWFTEGLTTPLGYYPPLSTLTQPPSLRTLKSNRTVDVIGIIRSSSPLSKTKGVDYILPLHIVDPSTPPDQGLSIVLFRPYQSPLPEEGQIKPGSVIILTDMKVQSYQHKGQLRTTESSGWILWPVGEDGRESDVVDSGPPVEFGEEEVEMVHLLRRWWTTVGRKRKVRQEDGTVGNGASQEENGVNGHVNGENGSGNV